MPRFSIASRGINRCKTKRFLIPALAALGLFFLGLSGLGLSSANAAGLSPLARAMTKPPSPAKAALRKFNGAGAADGGQAGDGAVDGDRGWGWRGPGWYGGGWGWRQGWGAPVGLGYGLGYPGGGYGSWVMAVVAVAAVAAMEAAAAGQLNLTEINPPLIGID